MERREQSWFVCPGECPGCSSCIPSAFTFGRCCSVRFSQVLEDIWTSWSSRHIMVCSDGTTDLLLRSEQGSLCKSAGAGVTSPSLGMFHSLMAPCSSPGALFCPGHTACAHPEMFLGHQGTSDGLGSSQNLAVVGLQQILFS